MAEAALIVPRTIRAASAIPLAGLMLTHYNEERGILYSSDTC